MAAFRVVTLNWNGARVLPGMLRSLAPQLAAAGARITVFDNGSTDGSDGAAAEEFGSEPWFELVRSGQNLGFAAGANRALAGVSEGIVVLANNDTVFEEGSLTALLAGLSRHPRAAVAGPLLLWPDGRAQKSMRDFPFAGRLLLEHLPLVRRSSAKYADHSFERRAEWLVGAVLAIRMDAFREAGGFDEDYFFYHEETDLQYRLSKAGHEVWLVPSARVVHYEGVAAAQKYGRDLTLRYIPAKLRFLRKNGHPGSLLAFRLLSSALAAGRLMAGAVCPGLPLRDGRCSSSYFARAMRALWRGGSDAD